MTINKRLVMSVLVVFLTLLSVPFALAQEDFTLTVPSQVSLCPCSGQGYKILVTNTGSETSTYSILLDAQSVKSVTVSPQSFSLAKGQAANVVAYVNSACSAKNQNITFTVSTNKGLAKALTHQIQFKSCYQFSLTPGKPLNDTSKKTVDFTAIAGSYSFCKGTERTIPLLIINEDLSFDNTYSLSLSGAPYASLSTNQFSLKKGASGIVLLNADMRSIEATQSAASITIRSEKGSRQLTKNLSIAVRDCYGVEASFEGVPQSACSGELLSIPLAIENTGNFQKRYGLELTAPSFASLQYDWVDVPAQQSAKTSLTLNPPADFEGQIDAIVKAVQLDAPSITSSAHLVTHLSSYSSCYALSIDAPKKFKISSRGHIPLTFNNEGSKTARASWSIAGPQWASLSGAQADIKPMQERHEVIFLSPNSAVERGTYALTINLTSDKTSVSKEITIELTDDPQSLTSLKYYAYAYRYYLYLFAVLLLIAFLMRNRVARAIQKRKARKEAAQKRMLARQKTKAEKGRSNAIVGQEGNTFFSLKAFIFLFFAILLGILIASYPTAILLFILAYGLQVLIAAILLSMFWFFVVRPARKNRKRAAKGTKKRK